MGINEKKNDNENSTEGVYDWDQKPSGLSWIDKLTADQAILQCSKWDLDPATTLEGNRVILKNVIRGTASLPVGPTPSTSAADQNQWLAIVQATAEAVGTQIAAALSTQPQHQPESQNQQQQSLPRILQDMAQAAPQCSGTDATKLLKFLIILNQIVKLQLATDKQILIAVLPKTLGQVRVMWTAALLANETVRHLVEQMVQTFLPDRAKQQLITQAVYRIQGPSESLTDYITEVQDAAEILLPPSYNLLDTILTGINSQTRARLAGFPAPDTLADLFSLIPKMEVVRQLEAQAQDRSPARYPSRFSASPPYSFTRPYARPAQPFSSSSRPYSHHVAPPRFPFRPGAPNSNYYASPEQPWQRPPPPYGHYNNSFRPPNNNPPRAPFDNSNSFRSPNNGQAGRLNSGRGRQ